MSRYIGITIGPIIDTIERVESPASLWASSYIFSYIMKRLYIALKDKGNIIVPAIDEDILKENARNEVGLFHDRLIIESEKIRFEDIENIKKSIFKDLSNDMMKNVGNIKVNDAFDFLNEYISLYYIEYSGEFNLRDISDKLSALERFHPFVMKCRPYILDKYFEKTCVKNSIFMTDAFGNVENSYFYDKNTGYLRDIDSIACGFPLEKDKKTNNYYALVQADGDGLGSFLCGLPAAELKKASTYCLSFLKKAHGCVKEYGGMTIYAGGDDMFFLAPVHTYHESTKKTETIFDLIDRIDNSFESEFIDKYKTDGVSNLTLSYSAGIYYKKFPLYEAVKGSYPLLDEAKAQKGKNSIALYLRLESGNVIKLLIKKSSGFFAKYKDMVAHYASAPENILNSVISKLSVYNSLYRIALENGFDQLVNVFCNINNELPEESKKKEYLLQIPQLMIAYKEQHCEKDEEKETNLCKGSKDYGEQKDNRGNDDNTLKAIDAALRILKFFSEREEEND